MIQIKKTILTLVALLAVTTGAWADETLLLTIESKDHFTFKSGSKTFDDKVTINFSNSVYNDGDTDGWYSEGTASLLTVTGTNGYTITSCKFYTNNGPANTGYTVEGESPSVYLYGGKVYIDDSKSVSIGTYGVTKIEVYTAAASVAAGPTVDWDKAEKEGKLDQMFVKGDTVKGQQLLQNLQYTRDPRLYETVMVNGDRQTLNWGDGRATGANWEMWVGGTTVGNGSKTNSGKYGTGYRMLKYIVGEVMRRHYPQWNAIMLSDMYLTYAEALLQADNNATEAIKYVDAVRARVGLKGLVECNPGKNLTSNKQALLDEILRERACDLSFQLERYFDLIRYKRADIFEKPLHGLRIYRLVQKDGKWVREESQWYNKSFNKKLKETDPNFYEPSHFDYERFQITTGARAWWTDGFDPKWYLQPFPITEVNKGYGLYQNAGW